MMSMSDNYDIGGWACIRDNNDRARARTGSCRVPSMTGGASMAATAGRFSGHNSPFRLR